VVDSLRVVSSVESLRIVIERSVDLLKISEMVSDLC